MVHQMKSGVGVILEILDKVILEPSQGFEFEITNNHTYYEALIAEV